MDLSFCVVNTNGGPLLARCLDAIERARPAGAECEVLVLDNASDDGSAQLVADRAAGDSSIRLIALDRRQGKAASDTRLLREAAGRYCLLLNEDAELLPEAAAELVAALDADPRAGAAGAQLLDATGTPQPCAWRFTGPAAALAGAVFLHRRFNVQSGGDRTRRVDWHQSSALLVRRDVAEQIGWLDPAFFVYGDEVDFCRRLADAGRHTLHVPSARAYHREGLSTGAGAARRIIQFHRGRDRYMRKHHGPAEAYAVRILVAWTYALRALAAIALPGYSPHRYALHVRAALLPWRGEGMEEAADEFNRRAIDSLAK